MFTSIQSFLPAWLAEMNASLRSCVCCPHSCAVNRLEGELGICRTDASFPVAAVLVHRGEEPVISGDKGIVNVFFAHCNLQCRFCQNHQISDDREDISQFQHSLESLLEMVLAHVDSGIPLVGFVSPSHVIPQARIVMKAIRVLRPDCCIVYNTNAYDKVESLRDLEGLVDIWLPDLKYMDAKLGFELSGVSDYPEVAGAALREMFRQKGSSLILDDEGLAVSGMIIRHLVLPGSVENSKSVLRFIAEDLSPRAWVSLMSQYFPAHELFDHPVFGRELMGEEYEEVNLFREEIGLNRGWVQDMESSGHYRPNFRRPEPFGDERHE